LGFDIDECRTFSDGHEFLPQVDMLAAKTPVYACDVGSRLQTFAQGPDAGWLHHVLNACCIEILGALGAADETKAG
jgi:hypothetical protein